MKQLYVVTGAAGRLGLLVTSALRAAGLNTMLIARRASDGMTQLDLARSVLPEFSSEYDEVMVVHLAATSSPRDKPFSEVMFNNVNSAFSISRLATDSRLSRLVLISSEAVYGAAYDSPMTFKGWSFPISERDTPHCVDVYGLSKLFMERLFAQVSLRRPELSISILRSSHVIFPDSRNAQLSRLKGDIAYAKTKLFSFVFAETLVSVILSSLNNKTPGLHVMNVAERCNVLSAPLERIIEEHYPMSTLKCSTIGEFDTSLLDITKCMMQLHR